MKIYLFENKQKRDGKNDPDITGTIQGDNKNVLHVVALWHSTSKNGLPYLSGNVNPPKININGADENNN